MYSTNMNVNYIINDNIHPWYGDTIMYIRGLQHMIGRLSMFLRKDVDTLGLVAPKTILLSIPML